MFVSNRNCLSLSPVLLSCAASDLSCIEFIFFLFLLLVQKSVKNKLLASSLLPSVFVRKGERETKRERERRGSGRHKMCSIKREKLWWWWRTVKFLSCHWGVTCEEDNKHKSITQQWKVGKSRLINFTCFFSTFVIMSSPLIMSLWLKSWWW